MRVEQLGSGTPAVAILAGVHGDEPCGVAAVERLLDERPSVTRPVKLVVANERALARGVRYVDEDLNRAFPGVAEAPTHEGRLAHRLAEELAGCLTLSLHSTQSHADPFAVTNGITEHARRICPQLPIAAVVDTGPFVEGRLFTVGDAIEVECGLQGSAAAAENAYRLARAFLLAVDALPGASKTTAATAATESPGATAATAPKELPVYRLRERIPKDEAETYEVFVANFERVDAGEPFAAADGVCHVADEPFYPVLLSSHGYRDVFGYTAEKVDALL